MDKSEQIDFLGDLIFTSQIEGTKEDSGKGKFERQLGIVDLKGDVPRDLASAMARFNAVRNVSAHNGGRVDTKYLERCPGTTYGLGEKVSLNRYACGEFVMGLQTYAMVICNRFRIRHTLRPIQCYQGPLNPFKASFNNMFPTAVPPEDLA